MEVKILEKKSKHLKIEVSKLDKGFLTALQKEMAKDENVTEVGVNFGHPLLNKFTLVVNTNGKISPIDAVNKATERISKASGKINDAFQEVK